MLTAKEIRRRFLEYFRSNSHEVVSSSPLLPQDDATLLFTNAGMVQFKKIFLGQEKRSYSRATTSQKCLRVSGKHNDLENVGRTARHHTFFEMLGNFSFGDYFKEEAIRLAWNFVTVELGLPKERLYVTIYQDDQEAHDLWVKVTGISPDRVYRLGEKDNFWSMGDTGPCGPCSEIYIDQGADMACGPNCGIGLCDCDRFLEIWNLVFMQYNQSEDGKRTPLPKPSIDTGMGLERVAAVCQNQRSNYDSDLFQDFIGFTAKLGNVVYKSGNEDIDTALRVIADHSRAAAFLIADGVLPSNEGRGYVLRRLIRRACRFGNLMGFRESFLYKCARKVAEVMGEDYPELLKHSDFICRAIKEEEERFSVTLEKGLNLLEAELADLSAAGQKILPGAVAFKLYDTFGFPLDIVNDICEKRGFAVDEPGFQANMKAQADRGRANWKGSGEKDPAELFRSLMEANIKSTFKGYATLEGKSKITALLDAEGHLTSQLKAGESGYMTVASTPFYGESGGQVGDLGQVSSVGGRAEVSSTSKAGTDLTVHHITVSEGNLEVGREVELTVHENDRLASARNHTSTHLLHAALKSVLGSHVHQKGSLVAPDRLRFDFTHIAAMSDKEIAAVEREVNRMILADLSVSDVEQSREAAIAGGAVALFGEKYGDKVRVVSIGGSQDKESVELCGGTHLHSTGQAGCFLILSESGVAAGVRRIEAATGWNALAVVNEQRAEARQSAALLKARPGELVSKIDTLQKEVKTLRKRGVSAEGNNGGHLDNIETINNITVLAAAVEAEGPKELRELMDGVRSKHSDNTVACLAAKHDGKVNIIIYVSKDLHSKFTAPALIKDVAAPLGGSGGGRPDLAQAGGTNPDGLDEAFAVLRKLVAG